MIGKRHRTDRCHHRTTAKYEEIVMLITFKSRAAPDVQMLDDLAKYLLGIVGKPLGERGVITHHEVDQAIVKLEAAIMVDKAASAEHDALHHHSDEDHHHDMPIGL